MGGLRWNPKEKLESGLNQLGQDLSEGADEEGRHTPTGPATVGRKCPPPGAGGPVLETQRWDLVFQLAANMWGEHQRWN